MSIFVDQDGNILPESTYEVFVEYDYSLKKKKDKEVFLFNPLTGEFDLSLQFNGDRIVSHQYNSAGTELLVWESSSSSFISMGPLVVFDKKGNVVLI